MRSVLLALALTVAPAAAAAQPTAETVSFKHLVGLADQIESTGVCPVGIVPEVMKEVRLAWGTPGSIVYFGANRVASELMFKRCLDQAEEIFSLVSRSQYASDYDCGAARDGLARTLARRAER